MTIREYINEKAGKIHPALAQDVSVKGLGKMVALGTGLVAGLVAPAYADSQGYSGMQIYLPNSSGKLISPDTVQFVRNLERKGVQMTVVYKLSDSDGNRSVDGATIIGYTADGQELFRRGGWIDEETGKYERCSSCDRNHPDLTGLRGSVVKRILHSISPPQNQITEANLRLSGLVQ